MNETDDIVIEDATPKTKRAKVSTVMNAVKEKIASWTFDGLATKDKTLVGAINEQNGDLAQIGKVCFLQSVNSVSLEADTQTQVKTFESLKIDDCFNFSDSKSISVNRNGVYMVSVGGSFGWETAKYCRVTVLINGQEKYSNQSYGDGLGAINTGLSVVTVLNTNDVLSVNVYSTKKTILDNAYMQITKIK